MASPRTHRESLIDPTLPTWLSSSRPLADVLDGTGDVVLAVSLAASDLLDDVGLDAEELHDTHEPSGEAGRVTTVPLPPGRYAARTLLLVGAGDGGVDDLRAAGAAVGRATRGRGEVVVALGDVDDDAALAAYVEGAVLGGWAPPRFTGEGVAAGCEQPRRVTVVGGHDPDIVRRALVRARATTLARSLAVTPSNIKNPAWMVTQARAVAKRGGLELTVWDERALRRDGFGGLLAVGQGSATPPRLVRLDHRPAGSERTPLVVLVGKGITFDSGGLQVKPAEGMLAMKTDMSGSAVVLAVMDALARLEVPVRVTGLLALAENAFSESSYRPDDVITHYGGRTDEIGNTDAEGRLVLADALAYADAELDPAAVVDVATLTGAARVALAREMAALFATDDDLRDALVAAGATTGETLWPMPLHAGYRRRIDSDVADLRHIAEGGGGAITAALFLREFAGERPWAHLDIAGPGRSDVDTGILGKGGTGFGTRLLLRWLEGRS